MPRIRFLNDTGLDARLLQCFETLASECSVSRAAERLNVSQPAMSRALARLREIFHDPLLIPRHGRLILSARALALKPEIADLRARLEKLVHRATPFEPATSRAYFSIMAAQHIEYLFAPALLERLLRESRGIDVDFRPSDPEDASALLERGDIDFRLGWWPNPTATMRHKLLFRDRLVCLARRGHPQIRGRISIAQYIEIQHVRVRAHGIGASMQAIDRAVSHFKKTLRAPLRVQNEFTMSQALTQSNLIASIPERLARKLAVQYPLQVLPLPLNVPELRIALYWHERTHNEASHRWFRQLLADTANAL